MRELTVTVGRSRFDTAWQARTTTWEHLADRLSRPRRTEETAEEYRAMNDRRRGAVKDVGGFVGGTLSSGLRRACEVKSRSLITLDMDFALADTKELLSKVLSGTAWALYSTHSHTPAKPRYRLVIPLSRDVSPEEYVPGARRIAERIGIDLFDDSTYEPVRLMYWPSCPKDGNFVFAQGHGDPLDPSVVLATYDDPTDPLTWPVSTRQTALLRTPGEKLGDPAAKAGIVGAFCRIYGIEEAIAAFLPDIYTADGKDRYTYAKGTTAGGLVVYGDKWAYSHHGTDPCGQREVNAFDLVRIQLFGDRDSMVSPDTPMNRLPSYTAMGELCMNDKRVKAEVVADRLTPSEDFDDLVGDWRKMLRDKWQTDSKGNILPTPANFVLVCENDPALAGASRRDIFTGHDVLQRDLPWAGKSHDHPYWRDDDDKGLIAYVSRTFNVSNKTALIDAHDLVMSQSAYHPVREYLDSLTWDGVPRLDTMLVDYLGAIDDPAGLTRAMTRKHFAAAAARIYEPGIKYDSVLTIIGREGIGKSTLIRKMGRDWFDDSFSSNDVGDKQAMEQVRGRWLIELGELTAYRKSTAEAFKAFISKQIDEYRAAYARKTESCPRQCVFFATTNEQYFLKGSTGNRRFWPVSVGRDLPVKDVFSMTDADVGQLWAEAVAAYKAGETLYLDALQSAAAAARQTESNELADDDRRGLIEAFIARPLPVNWYTLTRFQRAEWFRTGAGIDDGAPTIRREYICSAEVANECLRKDLNRYDSREINQILSEITGEEARPTRTKDAEYGIQKRFSLKKLIINAQAIQIKRYFDK